MDSNLAPDTTDKAFQARMSLNGRWKPDSAGFVHKAELI